MGKAKEKRSEREGRVEYRKQRIVFCSSFFVVLGDFAFIYVAINNKCPIEFSDMRKCVVIFLYSQFARTFEGLIVLIFLIVNPIIKT